MSADAETLESLSKRKLTDDEKEAFCAIFAAIRRRGPRIVRTESGDLKRTYPENLVETGRIMNGLGVFDGDFIEELLDQLEDLCFVDGRYDVEKINFILSAVKDIKPQDQFEILLCVQLGILHQESMKIASRLAGSRDSRLYAVNCQLYLSLTKQYRAHFETLKRHRNDRKHVTIQHISGSIASKAVAPQTAEKTIAESDEIRRQLFEIFAKASEEVKNIGNPLDHAPASS